MCLKYRKPMIRGGVFMNYFNEIKESLKIIKSVFN